MLQPLDMRASLRYKAHQATCHIYAAVADTLQFEQQESSRRPVGPNKNPAGRPGSELWRIGSLVGLFRASKLNFCEPDVHACAPSLRSSAETQQNQNLRAS